MFNKYIVISLLIIISGCNSDSIDSESEIRDEIPPVSDEVIPSSESEIVVVSSKIESLNLFVYLNSVVQNQTIRIKAFATYLNQTQKDVSSEVNWFSSDKKIATINAHGELLGVSPGTVFITAEKDGLVTKQFSVVVKTHLLSCGSLNDSDKTNVGGSCLKVVQGQSGEAEHKIFTGSPSVNVMMLLGYEINDTEDNRGKTYAKTFSEGEPYINAKGEGIYGPVGKFARFRQDGEDWDNNPLSPDFGKNGQYDRFCRELSLIGFFDKNDWRRASENEIVSLVKGNGHLYDVYGWPTQVHYWTSTSTAQAAIPRLISVGGKFAIRRTPTIPFQAAYISCVSETL
ncbi:Ig-like domain-containing protein [Photobacterium frigidiphilum]|uniref:Ig-like domain-containing protein n=1 Tax=Photobacterium frigidiphilum TaxID=264736 RepID=UPI003D118BF0